jgi:hypothetical protein
MVNMPKMVQKCKNACYRQILDLNLTFMSALGFLVFSKKGQTNAAFSAASSAI